MTVAAVEAAPAAAGGAGAGSTTAAIAGGGGGGMPELPKAKGVLLALAIVLLWLAGLAFFIALEGSNFLGEQATPTGAGFFSATVAGLAGKIAQQAAMSGPTAAEGSAGNARDVLNDQGGPGGGGLVATPAVPLTGAG